MTTSLKRFRDISNAVYTGFYTDLGKTEIIDEDSLENIKIHVVPNEGVHKDVNYIITIKLTKPQMAKKKKVLSISTRTL